MDDFVYKYVAIDFHATKKTGSVVSNRISTTASARRITILNGGFGDNVTSLLVPAVALEAMGYGHMWWKGVSFSDLIWGGALLEFSQFGDIKESRKMLQDAVSKLDEALAINPAKHEALWCLENAHTANAFLTPDHDEAKIQFEQAFQCFEKAVEEFFHWSQLCPGLLPVQVEHQVF
ncbi:Plant specific mitochondrial import receptor subunit TOM20 [Cynara cardunculus var. scolymus]|uniref:Plant specific mitochondrial import receptor subunit TOM20 n=1 Tax=Cynara cardunculus var. scolymus TaxID=59895 RepID=A0A103Y5N1_CYNCS|nr:Plant specific mitochondrial import receptor subunit TOM20 [Cynara cardunculus var. scolymus]